MPLFGGNAKREARCDGRRFTGQFDDCFNDYLPILELMIPIGSVIVSWMFARFAFVLWAPTPDGRNMRWRFASSSPAEDYWPLLHGIAALGALWAFWRASTYFFAAELWPFALFWMVFAIWFGIGLGLAWPRKQMA